MSFVVILRACKFDLVWRSLRDLVAGSEKDSSLSLASPLSWWLTGGPRMYVC